MQTIKINLKKISPKEVDFIVSQFKGGKIIIYPTDTIYGLGCDATNQKAVDKIFEIKNRPKDKPLLILASSMAMLKKYAHVNKKQADYIRIFRVKPTTSILKDRGKLAKGVAGHDYSLAARLPKSEFLTKIIKEVGKPIVSTSINISGEESILNPEKIEKKFDKTKPDIIINAGKLKTKNPSRIVDIRNIRDIKVLRK